MAFDLWKEKGSEGSLDSLEKARSGQIKALHVWCFWPFPGRASNMSVCRLRAEFCRKHLVIKIMQSNVGPCDKNRNKMLSLNVFHRSGLGWVDDIRGNCLVWRAIFSTHWGPIWSYHCRARLSTKLMVIRRKRANCTMYENCWGTQRMLLVLGSGNHRCLCLGTMLEGLCLPGDLCGIIEGPRHPMHCYWTTGRGR